MNTIALGLAMLVSSSALSPALEAPRDPPASFTFNLPDAPATRLNSPYRLLNEQPRPLWQGASRHGSLRAAQATPAKRFSRTERIIAIAGGACGGWLAGGAIGWAATSTSDPDDDVSGLRGVMIGAPIGAGIGAFVGYWLTK